MVDGLGIKVLVFGTFVSYRETILVETLIGVFSKERVQRTDCVLSEIFVWCDL